MDKTTEEGEEIVMTTQPTIKRKPTVATGVICKGCQGVHFFTGSKEQMVPFRDISGKYSIRCQSDGNWYEYELNDDETVHMEEPAPDTSDNQDLITRIIEMENRLAKLETKTAELPDNGGIKKLRDDMKGDFTGFLADSQPKTGSKEPKQYG